MTVVLFDGVADGQAFTQVEGHGFLKIDILAGLAGGDGLKRVPVGRRGDDHAVEVLHLEHLAEVCVGLARFLELAGDGLAPGLPDVTRAGDDHIRMCSAFVQIGASHSAAAEGIGVIIRLFGHAGQRCLISQSQRFSARTWANTDPLGSPECPRPRPMGRFFRRRLMERRARPPKEPGTRCYQTFRHVRESLVIDGVKGVR
jgi:hypothetical protein